MKRLVLVLMICVPCILKAQENIYSYSTNGIKWTKGLSWDQVQQKAKQDNKFIFVDCYTTWCGPCKVMDQQVFSDKEVGSYFNDKFISVKVQMDKTEQDDESVKSWYNTSNLISKQYHIDAFPTYLFFSPDCKILSKEVGSMQKGPFLQIAHNAILPGKVYNDPYNKYVQLKSAYQSNGIKDYKSFPYFINMAFKAQDNDFAKELLEEHTKYVKQLKQADKYTKENILLWSSLMLSSGGQRFRFFYEDGRYIDKVMNCKGYAVKVIDRTIWHEIVIPFLEEQAKLTGVAMTGGYLSGPGVSRIKPDYRQADWKKLYMIIQKKFRKSDADRNLINAKIEWSLRHRNFHEYVKSFIVKLEKYTFNLVDELSNINGFGWNVFLYVTDKNDINKTANWVKRGIEVFPKNPDMLDTYANLLYKVGEKEAAIKWQELAIKYDSLDKEKQNALLFMKRGEPTYISQGAVWQ